MTNKMEIIRQPLVSVIIPVYNAEKYLEECCVSVLAQSYTSIEIILVNDGSTDNSLNICEKIAESDPRVQVIHQENSGVSSARNAGIQASKGEFIVFVDADDILTENSISSRVELAIDVDLVICSYQVVDSECKTIRKMPRATSFLWEPDEALVNLFAKCEIGYQGYLWNKIYRNKIIKDSGILFENGVAYNEDQLFNLTYIVNCKQIRISNICVYNYRKNDQGAMGSIKGINDQNYCKYMSEFVAFRIMRDILKKRNQTAYFYCIDNEMRRAITLYNNLGPNSPIMREKLSQIARHNAVAVAFSRSRIPLVHRIKILLHGILLR